MKHNICISIRRPPKSNGMTGAFLAALAIIASASLVQAGQRPISQFTSRQGAYCLKFDVSGNVDCSASGYGGTSCELFVPPQPNVNGWVEPSTLRFVLVDYAGLANAIVGGAFGTTLDGSINEVPLADGRAEVSVYLHTKNAFTWASDISTSFPGPTLFGHRLDEVIAGGDYALGESYLNLTFKNSEPGAPLPDLIQLIFCPEPGQELESIAFRARANGTLRAAFGVADGTAGRLEVTQTGLVAIAGTANSNSRVALDAFPAEKIIIQPTGK